MISRSEGKVLSCSPDVTLRGGVLEATLWYPGTGVEQTIDAVEIDLVHVRAARSIRIEYDFDRNGYRVLAEQRPDLSQHPDKTDWLEVAFVTAWPEGGG